MVLRIILIVLVFNCMAMAFIIASKRSRREKVAWSVILLAIPYALWVVYRMFQCREKKLGDFKEWESK